MCDNNTEYKDKFGNILNIGDVVYVPYTTGTSCGHIGRCKIIRFYCQGAYTCAEVERYNDEISPDSWRIHNKGFSINKIVKA